MKDSKKQNTVNGGLYIALAICILSVICIGVYSAIINIFNGTLFESENVTPPTSTRAPGPLGAELPDNDPPIYDQGDLVDSDPIDEPELPATSDPDDSEQANAIPEVKSFSRPLPGETMKNFSEDMPIYSTTMNDYRAHLGLDIHAMVGEAVKCFADGKIAEIYEDPLMGETIVVDHGNGLKSIYQNLSPEYPSGIVVGKVVKEGDVIGGVGETTLIECAEEPHLHFSVTVNDVPVDPTTYFQ